MLPLIKRPHNKASAVTGHCFLTTKQNYYHKNDYKNALKKRLKAISILEPCHNSDADLRTASPLSNLYNNLSNAYLLMKKNKEATEALHTAFAIRQKYAHLGLAESHDMLRQLMNLTNMLIFSKNTDVARQSLSAYENLVLEHERTQTLDNGICQMMYGAVSLAEGKAKEAELHLLSAENIISEVMGTDNDYVKTVYLYLNNLYTRWQKPEQALAYKINTLTVPASSITVLVAMKVKIPYHVQKAMSKTA